MFDAGLAIELPPGLAAGREARAADSDRSRERRLHLRIHCVRLEGGEADDAAEVTLPSRGTPATVVRPLELGSGTWQARVVVTDRDTGAVGSVVHTFEVPAAGAPADER